MYLSQASEASVDWVGNMLLDTDEDKVWRDGRGKDGGVVSCFLLDTGVE